MRGKRRRKQYFAFEININRKNSGPIRPLPTIAENVSSSWRQRESQAALLTAMGQILKTLPRPFLLLLCLCSLNFTWLILFSGDTFHINPTSVQFPGDTSRTGRRLPGIGVHNESSVVVVIVSNRFSGILPTVGSILTHTKSKGVDLVLIGDPGVNQRVAQHFENHHPTTRSSLRSFTALTLHDIQADLEAQGYHPIWTWSNWGSSRRDEEWMRPNTTVHVADWDSLPTHAHELNHLRFYLPLVSLFRHHELLYFLDDDILVRKDLGVIAQHTLATLDSNMGMLTPCNIWLWENKCQGFSFKDENSIGTILEMPSLYGDRGVCRSVTERHCYPAGYPGFLKSVLPAHVTRPEQQRGWNFGFTLMALDNWRSLRLTQQYEYVMMESYRMHVFPETSLTFGLGVAYLALAGAVACWNDSVVAVRDGFGFIEHDRYAKEFGKDFMNTSVDVIHYTGPDKPWVPNTTIDTPSLDPWLHYMRQERMPIPPQSSDKPASEIFVVLATERAGAHWLMSELDRHPSVCASGEHGKLESGFPTDVLFPSGLQWLPQCSVKRSCTLEFIENAVLDLHETMDRRGRYGIVPRRCQHQNPAEDPLGENLLRICNFVKALQGDITEDSIETLWIDAFRREDHSLVGCSCPKGTKVKGLKVLMEWLLPPDFPEDLSGQTPLALASLNQSKVIRLHRKNLLERYLSTVFAEKSGVYGPRTYKEKLVQLEKVGNLSVPLNEMMANVTRMNKLDLEADRWAKSHGSSVLDVDYDGCRLNISACWENIHRFIGADLFSSSRANRKNIFKRPPLSRLLQQITNLADVSKTLASNGYESFLPPV